MWFDQTGLLWVPTSPHIPRADTSMFYAATGIMGELQVVSEGVGYTLPFELAGGPFVEDAGAFANELIRRKLPGVRFRPTYFTPYYMDHIKGKACGGVQIYITDRDAVDLTSVQFHVMDAVREALPTSQALRQQAGRHVRQGLRHRPDPQDVPGRQVRRRDRQVLELRPGSVHEAAGKVPDVQVRVQGSGFGVQQDDGVSGKWHAEPAVSAGRHGLP